MRVIDDSYYRRLRAVTNALRSEVTRHHATCECASCAALDALDRKGRK